MLFILPPDSAMAADNGCVNGILQDADKKAIAGITVKLSGTEEAETTTDADGKWAFSVKDDGDYTVTIDESVAEEHGLKSSSATVTIKKASFDKQRGVVRFDQVNDSASSGSSSSDSAPAPQAPQRYQRRRPAPTSASASGNSCTPASSSV